MPDVKISELPSAGPLTGDELLLISQSGVDYSVALSRLLDVPEPAAPSAFTSGLWAITAGDEEADVEIVSLPSAGSEPITDIEYRLDGGSAVSTGGTTDFTITGLTNAVEYDVEIRAVNSVGAGPWSDVKAVEPSEPSGAVTYSVIGSSLRASGTINVGSAATGRHIYVVISCGWGGINITGGSIGGQTLTRVANHDNETQIWRCLTPPAGSQSFSFTGPDGEPIVSRWFNVYGGGTTLTDTLEASVTGWVDDEIDAVAGGLIIYNAFAHGNVGGMTGDDFSNIVSDENEWTIAASGTISVETAGTIAIEQTSGSSAATDIAAVSIPPA